MCVSFSLSYWSLFVCFTHFFQVSYFIFNYFEASDYRCFIASHPRIVRAMLMWAVDHSTEVRRRKTKRRGRERERESVCVCVCVYVCALMGEKWKGKEKQTWQNWKREKRRKRKNCVWVWVSEWMSECVCACVSVSEWVSVCVCVSEWVRERERVCVCVCVKVSESVWGSVRDGVTQWHKSMWWKWKWRREVNERRKRENEGG